MNNGGVVWVRNDRDCLLGGFRYRKQVASLAPSYLNNESIDRNTPPGVHYLQLPFYIFSLSNAMEPLSRLRVKNFSLMSSRIQHPDTQVAVNTVVDSVMVLNISCSVVLLIYSVENSIVSGQLFGKRSASAILTLVYMF